MFLYGFTQLKVLESFAIREWCELKARVEIDNSGLSAMVALLLE